MQLTWLAHIHQLGLEGATPLEASPPLGKYLYVRVPIGTQCGTRCPPPLQTHGGFGLCHHGCSGGPIPTKTPEWLIQFSGRDDSFCKAPLHVPSTNLTAIAFVSYRLLVMAWSSVSLLFMTSCHLFLISWAECHWSLLLRSSTRSHLIFQIR